MGTVGAALGLKLMMKYAAQFPAQCVSQPWQFSRHFYNARKTHLAFFSHFVSIPSTAMDCGSVVGCSSALGFVLENYLQLHFIRESILHFHREKRRAQKRELGQDFHENMQNN